jgi:hypothetical protein
MVASLAGYISRFRAKGGKAIFQELMPLQRLTAASNGRSTCGSGGKNYRQAHPH